MQNSKQKQKFRKKQPRKAKTAKRTTQPSNQYLALTKKLDSLALSNNPKNWQNEGPTSRSNFSKSAVGVRRELEENGVRIGAGGIEFLRACLNPFGSDEPNGFRSFTAKIPDGSRPTLVYTLTYTHSYTGAGPILWQVIPPDFTSGYFLQQYSGGDPLTYTDSPTGKTSYAPSQVSSLLSVLNPADIGRQEYRITACGLRINRVSNDTNTSGVLRAFLPKDNLTLSSTTYQAFGHVTGYQVEEPHTVTDGITIRAPIDTTNYCDPPQYYYTYNTASPFTRLPAVLYSGGAAATVLQLEVVMMLEVAVNQMNSAISANTSPVEINTDAIIAYANTKVEMVVSGRTFKPLRKILNFAKNAYRFTSKMGLNLPLANTMRYIGGMA